ncbi:alpha/beta hydrolase [Cupriavidus sp. 2TAF22]|uniref:alpha/beta hydrolase n=1 Tax=unclassified Cupriavidus TaxID=2640874 RepID=UPI003F8E7222
MSNPSSLASLAELPSQDPAFFEREYNNRAMVPDNAAYMAQWAELSRQVRERDGWLEDLSYADAPPGPNAAAERLDYFPAHAAASKGNAGNAGHAGHAPPLLVFLHGGYWRALDKRDHSLVANALPGCGVSVAVVGYSLAPAVAVPAILLQAARSVAWLYRQSERLGHDRSRIFVAGHSVGGNMAAMMLATHWPGLGADLPADLVKGAVSVSGVHELEPLRRAPFLANLCLSEQDVARMSPARLLPATAAPLVTAVGELESGEYQRQSALLRAAWPANASVPGAVHLPMPGKHHFSVVNDFAERDSPLLRAVRRMIGVD